MEYRHTREAPRSSTVVECRLVHYAAWTFADILVLLAEFPGEVFIFRRDSAARLAWYTANNVLARMPGQTLAATGELLTQLEIEELRAK